MPKADFFAALGLYVIEAFLDETICRQVRAEMHRVDYVGAEVVSNGLSRIDESFRRTKVARVSHETKQWIEKRLLELCPELEQHFDVRLSGCQTPEFLRYRPGDFFGPHQDDGNDPVDPDFVNERQLSVSIFLNAASKRIEPDTYCGGSLFFYDLFGDPRAVHAGFPFVGETGLLVAFPASVRHEVTPITAGERDTIVAWFY